MNAGGGRLGGDALQQGALRMPGGDGGRAVAQRRVATRATATAKAGIFR